MIHLSEAIVGVKNKPKSIGSRNTFRNMDKGTHLKLITYDGKDIFQYYFTYMEQNSDKNTYYDVYGTNIKTGKDVKICVIHMSDLDKCETQTKFGGYLKIIL